MSGLRGGAVKKILDEEPRAVYTHCYGHALNLAGSDAVKGCKLTRGALDTSYEIIKLIKNHLDEMQFFKSVGNKCLKILQESKFYALRDGQFVHRLCRA